MARLAMDLSDVTEEQMTDSGGTWSVWPDGWYRMMCDDSDYKKTKAGDGWCLHLTHICLDFDKPQFNKKQMDFLTLEHPNETTRTIARVRLKQLATAIGHPDPDHIDDSLELHGKAFMARIYSEPANDPRYGDANGLQNKIGQYLSVEEYERTQGGRAQAAPGAQGGTSKHSEPEQPSLGSASPKADAAPPPPDDIPF